MVERYNIVTNALCTGEPNYGIMYTNLGWEYEPQMNGTMQSNFEHVIVPIP